METLGTYRSRYGSGVFLTILPDGEMVPWKPLTIGEYTDIRALMGMGQYPEYEIEDEIFKKCVLSKTLVERIDILKAGTVEAVAATILAYSGPQDGKELNEALDYSRYLAASVINQIAMSICSAFPAYKIEDILAMDYNTMMIRLAMAERRLLETIPGFEPMAFTSETQEVDSQPQPDLRQRYHEERGIPIPPPSSRQEPQPPPPSTTKQTIITDTDIAEATLAYTGHEKANRVILEEQMLRDTLQFYPEYVEQMKEGKDFTPIPMKKRVEKFNQKAKRNQEAAKAMLKKEIEEQKKLEKIIAQKRG